ncbi:MAG: S8 family serine peptidase [Tateyamaria sp.]
MTAWKPYHTMFGATPYSDWRVAAEVERYLRGANFDAGKLARAIRHIETGGSFVGSFFDLLRRSENFAVSAHFGPEKRTSGSRIGYAAPSSVVDNLFRDAGDLEFEFGPLVDRSILRTRQTDELYEPSFPTEAWSSNDAICAIIDDTIGFANARFRKSATETRIEALWIMDGAQAPSVPEEFEVFGGLVLFRNQIDALLERFYSDGAVDEAALYAHLDNRFDAGLNALPSETHGTHVLDLFAGNQMGSEVGASGAKPIIAVVLPQVAVRDSSGTHSEFFVQEAVAWINNLASRFTTPEGEQLGLVTNFSFGLLAGPHDGHSLLERSLATIPARPKSAAVLPAGNSFGSRTHAVAEVTPSDPSFSIDIEISPLNRLSTFVEIWRPEQPTQSAPGLQLAFETPWGDLSETDPQFGQGYEWCPGGQLTMRTYHLSAPRSPDGSRSRGMAMFAILPTDASDESLPLAPDGSWTLSFSLDLAEGEDIDIWIQRGGSVYGYPALGRQSRFKAGQSSIDDFGTLNALATAKKVVSVGGYVLSSGFEPASYTSAGSPRFYSSFPDVSAPSDQSTTVPGIVASGTFSGSYASLSGTSVAAPQVARLLTECNFGNDAKTFLERLGSRNPTNSPLRLGHGRLFLPESKNSVS